MTFFHCGKLGHISRECRSRGRPQVEEKQKPAQAMHKDRDTKEVICCLCRGSGHKSIECPSKKSGKPNRTVKRVEADPDEIRCLEYNEVVAKIGNTVFPMIIDSGAQISLVPIENLELYQFTNKRRKLNGA